MNYTLGFIGAGNMAEAIARGAIGQAVVAAKKMIAADPSPERRAVFESFGVAATEDGAKVVAESEQVMLAVKPQVFASVAPVLAKNLRDDQVVVSIMAGIGTAKIEAAVSSLKPQASSLRIVRVMPNTPLMVGKGMAGVCVGEHAQEGDDELTMKLFSSAGRAVLVDEAMIDAITAVSGSGPAYLYYLAEAMQEAAVQLGIGEHADVLVRQTIAGAAMLLDASSDSAAELRRKVTSPGGTTEAAINTMESKRVRAAIVEAIKAAEARSKELGS